VCGRTAFGLGLASGRRTLPHKLNYLGDQLWCGRDQRDRNRCTVRFGSGRAVVVKTTGNPHRLQSDFMRPAWNRLSPDKKEFFRHPWAYAVPYGTVIEILNSPATDGLVSMVGLGLLTVLRRCDTRRKLPVCSDFNMQAILLVRASVAVVDTLKWPKWRAYYYRHYGRTGSKLSARAAIQYSACMMIRPSGV